MPRGSICTYVTASRDRSPTDCATLSPESLGNIDRQFGNIDRRFGEMQAQFGKMDRHFGEMRAEFARDLRMNTLAMITIIIAVATILVIVAASGAFS